MWPIRGDDPNQVTHTRAFGDFGSGDQCRRRLSHHRFRFHRANVTGAALLLVEPEHVDDRLQEFGPSVNRELRDTRAHRGAVDSSNPLDLGIRSVSPVTDGAIAEA